MNINQCFKNHVKRAIKEIILQVFLGSVILIQIIKLCLA